VPPIAVPAMIKLAMVDFANAMVLSLH